MDFIMYDNLRQNNTKIFKELKMFLIYNFIILYFLLIYSNKLSQYSQYT